MSNIDKQALRQKSEAASAGEWVKESGTGWHAVCSSDDQANSGFIVAHFEGPDSNANREFVQAANPATVLALLDELEAKDKLIAELSHHLQSAHEFVEHTEAFGHEASNGILCCGDAQWNIDASKLALATAGKGE